MHRCPQFLDMQLCICDDLRAPTYKGYIPYTARVIAQAAYRRALPRTVKAEPSHLVAAVGFGSRTKDDETQ